MADNFEEKSGVVQVDTPWGYWFQTINEVFILVDVHSSCVRDGADEAARPICGKDIKCTITSKKIKLVVRGKIILEGEFPQPVHGDDSVWTLEDKKLVRVCLSKARATAGNVWPSLLVDQYRADPLTLDQMKRKQTLEQFQADNPGLNFSHSTISGNYQDGGPQLPTS